MKTKPWPLMILALLNFLCPAGNIFLSARLEGVPILDYLRSGSLTDLFPILIAPWIGAFAIYSVKKWSYPVFLSVMVYQTGSLFYQAHSFPDILSIRLVVFISLLNLGFVSYFMNSKVRTVYYDQRLKWWESSPRYAVSTECLIGKKEGEHCSAQIINISVGGVFIRCAEELQVGSEVELTFEAVHDLVLVMRAKILYLRNNGYGINFVHTKASKAQMKELIKRLKQQGVLPTLGNVTRMEDFRKWAKTKALKAEGWVPEVRVEKMLEDEKKAEIEKKTDDEKKKIS